MNVTQEQQLGRDVSKPVEIPANAYVIIIGAMKAGTTSLFNLLAQHPHICPSRVKEPEYFSEHQGHGLKVQRYADVFAFDAGQHRRCLEASTGYTKFPAEIGVPDRMRKHGIDPLFIYAVRNPFDRIESEYNFAHLGGKHWAQRDILNLDAVHRCMYYLQLREFVRVFPERERYRIVDFSDIRRRPRELANELFEWMGVQPARITPNSAANETPRRSRIEQRIVKKAPWTRAVPPGLRTRLRDLLRRFDKSAKRVLTSEERAVLHRWLERDMDRFQESFGYDVAKWGF